MKTAFWVDANIQINLKSCDFFTFFTFTTANPKFQYFKWLQMEILFASSFDRNKE